MLNNKALLYYLTFFSGLIFIFGCGDDNGSGPGNPTGVSNPYPDNRAENVSVLVNFSWTYYAAASQPIFYDFYLGISSSPPLYAAQITDTCYGPIGLMSDTTYYWKVIAYNIDGDTVRSAVWQFSTVDSIYVPIEIGRTWEFAQTGYNFGFEPDSLPQMIGEPITDTVFGSATTEICEIDTLNDSIEVYVFNTYWLSGIRSGETIEFGANEDDGFYIYAYHDANWIGPPKADASNEINYHFGGLTFASQSELHQYFHSWINRGLAKIRPDTIYEDPPIRELAYPVEVGARWIFRDVDWGHVWDMEKEVIGKENITVPAGDFECFKIRWFWDTDHDGQWDDWIDGYDYLTGAGIVKREFIFYDIIATNYQGDTLGTYNSTDIYEMTDFGNAK